MSVSKSLIMIPTYNESKTIGELVTRLNSVCNCGIMVLDDSDDQSTTANIARKAGAYVIQRLHKRGSVSAIAEGLRSLNGTIESIVVMDGDLQHPTTAVPRLLNALDTHDFVVASRYVEGGGCTKWDLDRLVITRLANLVARPLVPNIRDLASSFFGFHRRGLPDLSQLTGKGFKLMIELLVRGHWQSIVEVPYTYRAKEFGRDLIRFEQVSRYVQQLFRLYLRHR